MPPAGARLDLDPAEFTNREKMLTGTVYGSGDPAAALPALLERRGRGPPRSAPLVGASFPLERTDEAIRAALAGAPGASGTPDAVSMRMRREITAPGGAAPISHYCDAVRGQRLAVRLGLPGHGRGRRPGGRRRHRRPVRPGAQNLARPARPRGCSRRTSSRSTSSSRTSTTAR